MTTFQKCSLFLLRITAGWMFFYAGITKVLDPQWSAVFYLKGAKLFPSFYAWLLQPDILPMINMVNKWGLTLLGVSLVFGIFVRFSSVLGAILMLLYYFPLGFPYPNAHAYIVDEHIIYAAVLLFLAAIKAGRVWGLENWCSGLPVCSKIPGYRSWLG